MSTPLERLRERLARKSAARGRPGKGEDAVAPLVGEAAAPLDAVQAEPEPVPPRLVQRIVWGYESGVLPTPWLRGFKLLKALLEREGFAIRVDLLPLTAGPPYVDLLFVPDTVAHEARGLAPGARVVGLEERPEQAVFQTLVADLRTGTELVAPLPAAPAPTAPDSTQGRIVRYRGWERID